MGLDFDKLIKILTAEHADGCQNRIVIGGLDKFMATWLQAAEQESLPQNQQELVAKITASLQGYAQRPVTERLVAIQKTLEVLRSPSPEQSAAKERELKQSDVPRKERTRTGQSGSELKSPVTVVRGVQSALARRLAHLGVHTVEDLLYLFPRRYDDFSHLKTIRELRYGEEVTIIGVVQEAQNQQTRSGKLLTKAVISDGTGFVEAIWFNQPYLLRQLTRGRQIVLSGRVDQYLGRLTFQN
ncbi:MAG: OB-fold nucleic acid binding domain-containing protein, partial [Anaerolineae bacterium]